MTSAWLILTVTALLAIAIAVILPLYTVLLAVITILRAKCQSRGGGDANGKSDNVTTKGGLHSWSHINTSLFQGTVFHIRYQPMIHTFKYPLYFSVVDLDEASVLFGTENVHPDQQQQQQQRISKPKGSLWPLSSLMLLRDVDHLKNGEGLKVGTADSSRNSSMRKRISNLVHERTNGKLDLRSTIVNGDDASGTRRKILLVTHLMYYGYCFNPVSFYFIFKPNTNNENANQENDEEEEIDAIVVEISNTPWNEMSIYVLHPESVDTVEHYVDPSENDSKVENETSKTHRYKMRKNFHVSPFMTMDHDYDWKFRVSRNRIRVETKLIKQRKEPSLGNGVASTTNNNNGADKEEGGLLFFTAGFDIRRTIQPTTPAYPLQLARIILRFPIYCFIIQLWIHYEAVRLLMKGVEFIPHPEGSETGASKAIAVVMRPVFAAKDVLDVWWSSRGKNKAA